MSQNRVVDFLRLVKTEKQLSDELKSKNLDQFVCYAKEKGYDFSTDDFKQKLKQIIEVEDVGLPDWLRRNAVTSNWLDP